MIFLGGVHGVGKTYISYFLKDEINIFSASKLIEEYTKIQYGGYKKAYNIKNNQDCLVKAVMKKEEEGENFILDGHFCLFNVEGRVERISFEFYKRINVQGIIVLYDDEKEIERRIRIREHNSSTLTVDEITELQKEEIKYAKYIASRKKIPIEIIDCSNPNNIAKCRHFIHAIMEK